MDPPNNAAGNAAGRGSLWRSSWAPFQAILIAAFALVAAYGPGLATPDTTYILAQARGVEPVSNWHPVGYTAYQTLAWRVFGNASMMWLLQVALWLAAVWTFARRLGMITGPIILVIALWPPIALNMAALWKDDVAISLTLLCLASAMGQAPRRALCLTLLFAVAAGLARTDYLAVTLPLVAYAAWRTLSGPAWWTLPTGLVVAVLCLIFGHVAASKANPLTVENPLNPWIGPAMWDIAGVALRDDEPVTMIGQATVPDEAFAKTYSCDYASDLVFTDPPVPVNLPGGPAVRPVAEESAAFSSAWRRAILDHPKAYAEHRACTLAAYLGFGRAVVRPFPGLEAMHTGHPVKAAAYRTGNVLSQGPFFRMWFYLLAGGALIALAPPHRRVLAGFVYASMLAAAARGLVLPASDVRYGLWIVLGGLCLAAFAAERFAPDVPRSEGGAEQ